MLELCQRLEAFLSEHLPREGKSPATVRKYSSSLQEFIRRIEDTGGVPQINTHAVQSFVDYLRESRRLSAGTVSSYPTALGQFCSYLAQFHLMPENPAWNARGVGFATRLVCEIWPSAKT